MPNGARPFGVAPALHTVGPHCGVGNPVDGTLAGFFLVVAIIAVVAYWRCDTSENEAVTSVAPVVSASPGWLKPDPQPHAPAVQDVAPTSRSRDLVQESESRSLPVDRKKAKAVAKDLIYYVEMGESMEPNRQSNDCFPRVFDHLRAQAAGLRDQAKAVHGNAGVSFDFAIDELLMCLSCASFAMRHCKQATESVQEGLKAAGLR